MKSLGQYLTKVKKWISHCIFETWFYGDRVSFSTEKFSEKAKLPKICLSFGGSMPEGKFKQCPLTPPPLPWVKVVKLWIFFWTIWLFCKKFYIQKVNTLQLEDQKTMGNFPSEKWGDLKWVIRKILYNNSTASVHNLIRSCVFCMSLWS